MNQVKKKLPRRPFFARFLDRQDLQKVNGADAPPDATDKHPSDKEDHVDFPEG